MVKNLKALAAVLVGVGDRGVGETCESQGAVSLETLDLADGPV